MEELARKYYVRPGKLRRAWIMVGVATVEDAIRYVGAGKDYALGPYHLVRQGRPTRLLRALVGLENPERITRAFEARITEARQAKWRDLELTSPTLKYTLGKWELEDFRDLAGSLSTPTLSRRNLLYVMPLGA